ncbi:MAG TPA: hypothetical protein VFX35_11605 [Solirubrobacterales bacterium]|nr:hypothetical protein [Solirubrobacterales bacterium]
MAFALLCALAVGAFVALASGGGQNDDRPRLSGLAASLDDSGAHVVVTGNVRGAGNVLVRYRKNCRLRRLSHAARVDGGRFWLRVPLKASRSRARRCGAAVAKRARARGANRSGAAPGGVQVFACGAGVCIERRVTLKQSLTVGGSGPSLAAVPGGGRVTVAPGVTVRVPTAPPVAPDVPATRFVATDGSDSGDCVAGSPCRTFNRAYEVAQPGEVVDVAGGTYPEQRIENDADKTSTEDVYFRPAAGSFVDVDGNIEAYGSHVTFMAMRARDTNIPYDGPADVSDVTFWGMDGRNFTIDSGRQVSVIGGDYGPASDCGGSYGGSNNGIRMNRPGVMPTDILIWGVDIHDIQSYDLDACHIECLIVGAVKNLTVRGSAFWNCSIFDIFLQPFNGTISGVTLENNWFATPTDPNGHPNSGRAVEFSGGGPWRDVLIRHNSVNTAINLNDGAPDPQYENVSVVGNVAERAVACYKGVSYRYNVWFGGGVCDQTDVAVSAPPFANASDHADLDYHLTGGPAVDLVPNSASNLADDFDNEARPKGSARDAGSDER